MESFYVVLKKTKKKHETMSFSVLHRRNDVVSAGRGPKKRNLDG